MGKYKMDLDNMEEGDLDGVDLGDMDEGMDFEKMQQQMLEQMEKAMRLEQEKLFEEYKMNKINKKLKQQVRIDNLLVSDVHKGWLKKKKPLKIDIKNNIS